MKLLKTYIFVVFGAILAFSPSIFAMDSQQNPKQKAELLYALNTPDKNHFKKALDALPPELINESIVTNDKTPTTALSQAIFLFDQELIEAVLAKEAKVTLEHIAEVGYMGEQLHQQNLSAKLIQLLTTKIENFDKDKDTKKITHFYALYRDLFTMPNNTLLQQYLEQNELDLNLHIPVLVATHSHGNILRHRPIIVTSARHISHNNLLMLLGYGAMYDSRIPKSVIPEKKAIETFCKQIMKVNEEDSTIDDKIKATILFKQLCDSYKDAPIDQLCIGWFTLRYPKAARMLMLFEPYYWTYWVDESKHNKKWFFETVKKNNKDVYVTWSFGDAILKTESYNDVDINIDQ